MPKINKGITSYGVTLDIRFNECPGPLNSFGFTVSDWRNAETMLDWAVKNRKLILNAVREAKEERKTTLIEVGKVKKKESGFVF